MISNQEAILLINLALGAGKQLRLHQNGFIQLDLLADNFRLHIWSPNMPKAQDPRTPIHNHTFDFSSQVLVGELVHQEYEWIPERSRIGEIVDQDIICELFTGAGDYEHLVPTGVMGTYHEGERLVIQPGYTYAFQHGKYHDSWADKLTATIMHKTAVHQIAMATVVVPLAEGGPDNDFRRDQYPQETLMPFVARVIGSLQDLENRRHV